MLDVSVLVEVSVVEDPGYDPDVPELDPSQAQAALPPESASTATVAAVPNGRLIACMASPFIGVVMTLQASDLCVSGPSEQAWNLLRLTAASAA